MAWTSTWTIVLRCYKCATRFTLPHLTFDTLTTLPLVAPCPYCGAQPVIRSKTASDERSSMHDVLDLTHDRERPYARGRAA
jgi:rRNA maturation endonuclease Nob1